MIVFLFDMHPVGSFPLNYIWTAAETPIFSVYFLCVINFPSGGVHLYSHPIHVFPQIYLGLFVSVSSEHVFIPLPTGPKAVHPLSRTKITVQMTMRSVIDQRFIRNDPSQFIAPSLVLFLSLHVEIEFFSCLLT